MVASLNSAILDLLRNALDADAGRVTVSVDYSRGSCVVEDDGSGIPPSEFLEEGGLGKLYCESACFVYFGSPILSILSQPR